VGDLGEGEVFGGAGGALLPVEKELAVAVGEAGGGIDAKIGQGLIDPGCGTFELRIVADRGFVDDEMGGGGGVQGVGPLGAELLVDEGWNVAELAEDLSQCGPLCDGGLSFDANFVAGGVDGSLLIGLALVGEGAEVAILTDTKDLPPATDVAVGGVVEGVVLEGAGRGQMKTEFAEAALEGLWIGNGELQFDLGSLHWVSIRLEETVAAIG
jgi:hypothetical protein